MTNSEVADTWSDGAAYEAYVGRWSRRLAPDFVSWLAQPSGGSWLDVGCGTGALTSTILAMAEPARVVGVDSSAAYAEDARRRIVSPIAEFQQADAGALAFDAAFDAAVSGLCLNFVGDPQSAVEGMARAVLPGGVVAAYVWDYAGRMDLMRLFWAAATAVEPGARAHDEGPRFPLCRPEALSALWREGGLRQVETTALDITTQFQDFDDYWTPFLGGQGAAPAYAMSLPSSTRDAIRDTVRAMVVTEPDGTIVLMARAWAVKGVTPH